MSGRGEAGGRDDEVGVGDDEAGVSDARRRGIAA